MPYSILHCSACGRDSEMRKKTDVLSHDCPVTGTIRTVNADGVRVDPEDMDPRNIPFPYHPAVATHPDHKGEHARQEGRF